MAPGAKGYYPTLLSKCDSVLTEGSHWSACTSEAASILSVITNIILRLPALKEVKNYGTIISLAGTHIPGTVYGKQLIALESAIDTFHHRLKTLRGVSSKISKIATETFTLVANNYSEQSSLQPGIGNAKTDHEIADLLQDIARQFRAEICLQAALSDLIGLDTSVTTATEATNLLRQQVNVDQSAIEALRQVVFDLRTVLTK